MSDTFWKMLTQKTNDFVKLLVNALFVVLTAHGQIDAKNIYSNLINQMSKMALTNAYLIGPWQMSTIFIIHCGTARGHHGVE